VTLVNEQPDGAPVQLPATSPKTNQEPATIAEAIPATHSPEAPVIVVVAKQPASPARRVSRSVLDDLDDGSSCVGPEPLKKELTSGFAAEIFNGFRTKLREEGQSAQASQFDSMNIEVPNPDEVRIVCPNDMAEEYAKKQRDTLINLFCAETGQTVRVTTETRLDPNAVQTVPIILSKQELYDVLSRQNPALATLKEGLNLQLDY
jgi:hypothetical protein